MQCHPDFGKGKRRESIDQLRFDEEWRCLTEDLNAIGPPIRTSMEWRKVWTDFKANKRRKLATSKTNARVGEGSKRKRNTNWAVTGTCFKFALEHDYHAVGVRNCFCLINSCRKGFKV